MAVVLVTYDLRKPGQNYSGLFKALRKHTHCKELESVWLLDTTDSVSEVRDSLKGFLDQDDILFVARLRKNWAALNYGCGAWLKGENRNW
ncbi:MAG: hypothetical protein P1U65_13650 [Minwuia sp.]|nr:hypothetical protein [Minwuia sp.]